MPLQSVIRETAALLADVARRDPDIAVFSNLLAQVALDGSVHAAAPVLPVCRLWAMALGLPPTNVSILCTALAALAPRLTWTQNPNYRRSPPSPGFLDNYGYAVLAGPSDGPPALARHDQLAFGVLLLGPHTHYPLHYHPAAEVYIPINTAEWWRGEGPWREEAPGAVIHHPPNIPHATRAGDVPLAALYLWRGELATHAKLTGTPSPLQG